MSGAPQFPDRLGIRRPLEPGALASLAGPSLEERIANLERGALGRPGPGVSDGSVITSDTSQVGGVKWGARSRRTLAAQACAFVGGSLTTTAQVITDAGVLRATSGCGDAVLFRYTASEWTVGGVVATFGLDSTFSNNATAPGQTVQCQLYVVTGLAGGAGSVAISAATLVSTNSHAGMTAGSASHVLTSGISLSDGNLYYLTVNTASGTTNANNAMNVTAKLYAEWPA